MGWDDGLDGMGWDGVGWDGVDGMGWGRMGWDGVGWNEMGGMGWGGGRRRGVLLLGGLCERGVLLCQLCSFYFCITCLVS